MQVAAVRLWVCQSQSRNLMVSVISYLAECTGPWTVLSGVACADPSEGSGAMWRSARRVWQLRRPRVGACCRSRLRGGSGKGPDRGGARNARAAPGMVGCPSCRFTVTVEALLGQRSLPGRDGCQECLDLGGAFPGDDAFRTVGYVHRLPWKIDIWMLFYGHSSVQGGCPHSRRQEPWIGW